ncbi:glycosyltransferase [Jannaschia sp. W003]|uniref:glycosyltransferase n=1 Tax=Jannaschia sp. W003 TaxID=2867012 RepID=UPI0021A73A92|nr:glycosyltransferase [Jannaschia sp. W003]UWQ21860.1 glycosyltransferase [Jannaschia sp. W003]
MTAAPSVLILMATFDGARHLEGQLRSIEAQRHRDWALWVSDDGSSDGTRELVEAWARGIPQEVRVVAGPRRGATANFLHLLARDDLPLGPGTHVAFSDQDDVWFPEKLGRALARLRRTHDGRPALYGARAEVTDEALRPVGLLPGPPRGGLRLADPFAWNPVGGLTAMLDPGAAALLRGARPPRDVPFHDWWISLAVAACGGRIEMDEAVVMRYRQHGANVMGARGGPAAALRRLGGLTDGRYGAWMQSNARALLASGLPLLPDARALARELAAPAGPLFRLLALRRHGLRRRDRVGTVAMWAAAATGRL